MITPEQQAEVQQIAQQFFDQSPDWVTFYREMLGMHGIVRQAFPSRDALVAFEQTEAYQEILRLLANLRKRGPLEKIREEEPTRVITVRVPKSLHESLQTEAYERRTSVNKLCISKLLQYIDAENVPKQTAR